MLDKFKCKFEILLVGNAVTKYGDPVVHCATVLESLLTCRATLTLPRGLEGPLSLVARKTELPVPTDLHKENSCAIHS